MFVVVRNGERYNLLKLVEFQPQRTSRCGFVANSSRVVGVFVLLIQVMHLTERSPGVRQCYCRCSSIGKRRSRCRAAESPTLGL
jgi:hypothetical protein